MLKKLFGSNKEEFFVTIDSTAAQTAPETVSVTATVPQAKEETTTKPPVVSVTPVSPVTVAPTVVEAVEAPVSVTTSPSVSVSGFATIYLKPGTETLARRRPSANMSDFLGMAREMKRR